MRSMVEGFFPKLRRTLHRFVPVPSSANAGTIFDCHQTVICLQ
jgi:hypothetical protein